MITNQDTGPFPHCSVHADILLDQRLPCPKCHPAGEDPREVNAHRFEEKPQPVTREEFEQLQSDFTKLLVAVGEMAVWVSRATGNGEHASVRKLAALVEDR